MNPTTCQACGSSDCIVDGNTVHEVKASPLNGRGEWVPERERVVMVEE